MGVQNVRCGLCMGIILIMNSLGQNSQGMVGEELGDAEIVALFIVQVRHMVAAVAQQDVIFPDMPAYHLQKPRGGIHVGGNEYFVPGQIFPDPGNNAFRLRLIPQIRMKRGTEKKDERASEKAAEPLGPFMECQPAFHVFPLFFRESGNMERELLQERENGHAC